MTLKNWYECVKFNRIYYHKMFSKLIQKVPGIMPTLKFCPRCLWDNHIIHFCAKTDPWQCRLLHTLKHFMLAKNTKKSQHLLRNANEDIYMAKLRHSSKPRLWNKISRVCPIPFYNNSLEYNLWHFFTAHSEGKKRMSVISKTFIT